MQTDAKNLLQNTNKEVKTLLISLNKVVASSKEDFHIKLYESTPMDIEVFDNVYILAKVDL